MGRGAPLDGCQAPRGPRPGAQRAAREARLDDQVRGREALAGALATLRIGDTPEAAAKAIARAVLESMPFGFVAISSFAPSGNPVPLVVLDQDGAELPMPGPLLTSGSAYVLGRASNGPWVEDWSAASRKHIGVVAAELDVRDVAFVPIRSGDEVIGLLAAGRARDHDVALAERLPALTVCATFTGAVLGPQVRSRNLRTLDEARVRAIIAEQPYLPVFQPIVDLESRATVGFEGLIRFADASPPDKVFAEAARCGAAIDLEAGTLRTILEASRNLPASAWLNVNVSADLVLAGEPLASILRTEDRRIVIELTEHAEVSDYRALRAAIERLRPAVRLAVDDAGAGYASFRHILELRPDYVKLARAIVHRVDRDPARQALVAGMVQFAAKTGAEIVAEGVESEAEVNELRRLRVALGQGYRLGRPALPAPQSGPASGRPPRPAAHNGRAATRQSRAAGEVDIARAVNIGRTLAAALKEIGVATLGDLLALGAHSAWERLRQVRPNLATARTLLQLEGATRSMRVTQLPLSERSRLRLFANLSRRQA